MCFRWFNKPKSVPLILQYKLPTYSAGILHSHAWDILSTTVLPIAIFLDAMHVTVQRPCWQSKKSITSRSAGLHFLQPSSTHAVLICTFFWTTIITLIINMAKCEASYTEEVFMCVTMAMLWWSWFGWSPRSTSLGACIDCLRSTSVDSLSNQPLLPYSPCLMKNVLLRFWNCAWRNPMKKFNESQEAQFPIRMLYPVLEDNMNGNGRTKAEFLCMHSKDCRYQVHCKSSKEWQQLALVSAK